MAYEHTTKGAAWTTPRSMYRQKSVADLDGVRNPYLVLPFRSSTDFHVSVPDVVPAAIAREVEVVVRRALQHISGVWRVTVERSPDRGRWRLELRGPTGRHSWTFLGAPEKLPAVIDQKLVTFVFAAGVRYQTHYSRALATSSQAFD